MPYKNIVIVRQVEIFAKDKEDLDKIKRIST